MTGIATFGNLFDTKRTGVRMLKVKITDGKEFNEEKEGLSFKKIFKSVQSSAPKGTKELRVEYTNRKGTQIDRWVKVPMGRSKKIGR
tara:strand:- start:194 stop:454 length:261 start_codon:yes stop_codon:yes gene_type:complete